LYHNRPTVLAVYLFLTSSLVGFLDAIPEKVVDLAFSQAQSGSVPDAVHPNESAVIPTYSVYGRLRGKSALSQAGVQYATSALGRSGDLDALSLGDSGAGLGPIDYLFETGKPFSLELWVYARLFYLRARNV